MNFDLSALDSLDAKLKGAESKNARFAPRLGARGVGLAGARWSQQGQREASAVLKLIFIIFLVRAEAEEVGGGGCQRTAQAAAWRCGGARAALGCRGEEPAQSEGSGRNALQEAHRCPDCGGKRAW